MRKNNCTLKKDTIQNANVTQQRTIFSHKTILLYKDHKAIWCVNIIDPEPYICHTSILFYKDKISSQTSFFKPSRETKKRPTFTPQFW